MVSVNQVYMVGHMKNADGSINNRYAFCTIRYL